MYSKQIVGGGERADPSLWGEEQIQFHQAGLQLHIGRLLSQISTWPEATPRGHRRTWNLIKMICSGLQERSWLAGWWEGAKVISCPAHSRRPICLSSQKAESQEKHSKVIYKALKDKGGLGCEGLSAQRKVCISLNFLFETWHLGTSKLYIFMSHHVMSQYMYIGHVMFKLNHI